jgi:hypothetical protein
MIRWSHPQRQICRDKKGKVCGAGVPDGPFPLDEADRMFTLLVKRAAQLAECRPGSPEEEFDRLVNTIEAYEAKRWPGGRQPRRR